MLSFVITPELHEVKGGHIPNFVTPVWFEKARAPLWEKVTSLGEPDTIFGVVRHASYDFQRELFPGSDVTIKTAVKQINTTSAVCHQEAWQSGKLAVVAEVILVLMDEVNRGKAPLNTAARTYLESVMVAD